jgi:hypothetical protein
MSVPERRAMVERPGESLSVRRQCAPCQLSLLAGQEHGRTIPLAVMRRSEGAMAHSHLACWNVKATRLTRSRSRIY